MFSIMVIMINALIIVFILVHHPLQIDIIEYSYIIIIIVMYLVISL